MSEEQAKYEMSPEAKSKMSEQFLRDFILIDEQIESYRKKRDALIKELLEKAPGLTVMICKNNDGTWTRVKLIDHIDEFKDGYYVPTKISRYQIKVDVLKNTPIEMRERDAKKNKK